jgi:hypothetical protein
MEKAKITALGDQNEGPLQSFFKRMSSKRLTKLKETTKKGPL